MYDKWLSDNSRSSTADISIKAFIAHCHCSDPALFVNLSSNANIDCDALIDAFENGTILDETAPIVDTGDFSAVNVTDTGEKKKRGRPTGKRSKNSVNLKKTIVQSSNRKDKYYSSETLEQTKKRRSKNNERQVNLRNNETPEQVKIRRSKENERNANFRHNATPDQLFRLGSFDFPCKHCGALYFSREGLPGQYHYRIQGSLYHLFNHAAHPIPGESPSYAQMFFLDTQEASTLRSQNPCNAGINCDLFHEIENELKIVKNPLRDAYKMMWQIEEEQEEQAQSRNRQQKRVTLVFSREETRDRNDLPPTDSNEVAAVYVTNAEGDVPHSYVTVYDKDGYQLAYDKAYAEIAYMYFQEKGQEIMVLLNMPEPNMELNDLLLNLDAVSHAQIAEAITPLCRSKFLISVAACESSLYTSLQNNIFRLLSKPSTFPVPFHARHHCSVSTIVLFLPIS
ncbi:hypothetical protein DdX_08160 [Ditylenchus destructor]|uniref:Uncharacterized protein n=1 Tax=Ditylenchus destructor TaxID=166010 RepID=A0AAD4N609_9BILA|nr:hypothetical protein DdX_08160 [Ditylenchus destructor]